VRALAGACRARDGGQPVALFARKAADCLGSFYGDAERTLRLLFEEVRSCVPQSLTNLNTLDRQVLLGA